MKKFLGIMLLSLLWPATVQASELEQNCVDQSIGSETKYADLYFDKAEVATSSTVEGFNYYLVFASSAYRPNQITAVLIREQETCKALLVDMPGNGINFNNYLPAEVASSFKRVSLEYSRNFYKQ